MDGISIIIIAASIGFIIIGLIMLKSKKLKEILTISNMYKDVEKYINFNGKFNILIGAIGIGLGIINTLLEEKSNYIVIAFVVTILFSTIIQKIVKNKHTV